jgi:hypothetical protein
MASRKLGNEMCSRCDRHLSVDNTNPDKLCGRCQNDLNAHRKGAAYLEWVKAGMPRCVNRMGTTPAPVEAHKINVRDLPDALLILCAKELRRRADAAKKLVSAMRGV